MFPNPSNDICFFENVRVCISKKHINKGGWKHVFTRGVVRRRKVVRNDVKRTRDENPMLRKFKLFSSSCFVHSSIFPHFSPKHVCIYIYVYPCWVPKAPPMQSPIFTSIVLNFWVIYEIDVNGQSARKQNHKSGRARDGLVAQSSLRSRCLKRNLDRFQTEGVLRHSD